VNIGEESEPIEVPIPLMPGETQQPEPQVVPEPEPVPTVAPTVPEKVGA
jgi:hypothetical protein